MKKKTLILLAVGTFLAFCFAGYFIFYPGEKKLKYKQQTPLNKETKSDSDNKINDTKTTVTSDPVQEPPLFKSERYPPETAAEKAMWEWWRAQRKIDPNFEWKRDINFYGRVVDENDLPVAGALVRCNWTTLSPSSSGGTEDKTLISDNDGNFSLLNQQGKRLTVSVAKEGFHSSEDSMGGFEYAAFFEPTFHTPDPSKPYVFRLRKKGKTEPLIKNFKTYSLKANGKPEFIDFKSGKLAQNGDLSVTINREDSKPGEPFDYSIEIKTNQGGGLIEKQSNSTFVAPSVGYEESISIAQQDDAPSFTRTHNKNFYVKTSDGKYASLSAELTLFADKGASLQLLYYYNPSGSKNLEYDPKKQINR